MTSDTYNIIVATQTSSVKQLPPGPPHHWLLGNLREVRKGRLGFYTHCARTYGPVTLIRFLRRQVYLISDPAGIENILVNNSRSYIKHFALRMNPLVLGEGLLTSSGDFWLRQRRLMQPAFLREQVASYASIFVELAAQRRDAWQPGSPRDIMQDMMNLALEIAARTLFDARIDEDGAQVKLALDTFQETFQSRFGLMMLFPTWFPTPANLRARFAVRRLDRIIYRFIEERRRTQGTRRDLLSLLLAARDEDTGRTMTDKQLRDEAVTLFLAGHETTALTLSWAWYLLATHPDAQATLLAEVDALGGRLPGVDDLPALRYTEQVVMETMRLYPPAYVVGREAIEEVEVCGYRAPPGMTFIMSQWVMHRDPRFWEEPDRFVPERWENNLQGRLPRIVYFPFGAGPRQCIGNMFALMETVLVLATLAQRWRFTVQAGFRAEPAAIFTLRPRDGIPATMTLR
ncbi:MAG: cytochrome P450 [Gemmataceae bacterium]